jgi:ATP-binding cassette, subfamily F, member 3
MLVLNDITFRIAGRVLLEKTSLSIPSGYRVGLVGLNGTGKSTLFKLIAGELEVDSGKITLVPNIKLGMVRQDLPDDDTTLLDVVLAADTERADLLAQTETITDPMAIADVYARLEDIDAYNAPARASIILSGLGFDQEAQNKPISDFSGGWRMRVALAAALFRDPDLLMLDEPTNHLDFEAIVWLENYLASFTKTLIIISHDRDILNKTATHIVHLDQLKLTSYTGNYDQFEVLRAQKLYNHQALFEKQQAQKKKMMAFVDRFRAKASKARQAQSRLKSIEKMDMVDAIIAERATSFTFPEPEELAPPMITLDGVDIGYVPGKPILKNLNLRIDMEDRIALLGANGNGKSTLIKLLSGTLEPLKGEVNRSTKLRVGYFAQHQTEELDMKSTAYQLLKDSLPNTPEPKIRAILGKFNFDKHKADTKIEELSGGEKARLLFCLMSHDAPHIMLLDEPTNHLDMDAREALVQALNNYNGCVILVSHDPHLVECVADQLWLIKDSKCTPYNDDLESYRNLIIEQRRTERADAKKSARNAKVKQKKGAKEEDPLKKAEKDLEQLNREKDRIENEMTLPKALESHRLMSELLEAYTKVKAEIERAEYTWIKIQEDEEGPGT